MFNLLIVGPYIRKWQKYGVLLLAKFDLSIIFTHVGAKDTGSEYNIKTNIELKNVYSN